MLRTFRALAGLLLVSAFASTSSAGLVVENGPATQTSFRIGGTNTQVEAVVWEQTATTGTSISALIGSVGVSSQTVDVYLLYNTAENVVATATVNVGAFSSPADFTPVTLFSGLSLPGGAYAIVLYNADTTGDVNVRWSVGAATTDTSSGTFVSSAFANGANANTSNPNLSNFTNSPSPLGFSVTGVTVVPEPSTLLSALGSVVVVGLVARRRRKA